MASSLSEKVVEFLMNNQDKKFTAKEISNWILATYPDECLLKQKRSTATVKTLDGRDDILRQITAEIGARRPRIQKKHPKIKTTEGRPRRYYFTTASDKAEVDYVEQDDTVLGAQTDSYTLKEPDLYPILSKFILLEMDIYSKRIDEKRSSNTKGHRGNIWLHPDVVGIEDLSADWHNEIKDCIQQYGVKKTKLWSFEVKIKINRSNLRESFFQTVSNSSWANFGYLVATEIEGTETMNELRMLSGLHGIGFILLDVENISESQILIPAKERADVDWNTVNRLTLENKDFLEYVKLVRQFYQTGEIRRIDWELCG